MILVDRTLADLNGADGVTRIHVAEALTDRRVFLGCNALLVGASIFIRDRQHVPEPEMHRLPPLLRGLDGEFAQAVDERREGLRHGGVRPRPGRDSRAFGQTKTVAEPTAASL